MSYTPGPWVIRPRISLFDGIHQQRELDCEIVGNIVLGGSTPVCKMYPGFKWYEGNKILIAAAPDLLEALEELSNLMQGVIDGTYKPDSFTFQPAKHAIAKAKGETL